MVTEPFEPQAIDSYMPIPTKPGLGVDLNDEVVSKYDCIVVK